MTYAIIIFAVLIMSMLICGSREDDAMRRDG